MRHRIALILYSLPRLMRFVRRKTAVRFNRLLAPTLFEKYGKGTRIEQDVILSNPECVSMGENCFVTRGCRIGSELEGGQLVMADNVQINADCLLDHSGGLFLEDNVLVSEKSIIYTHDHGYDPRSKPVGIKKTIGRNVWIGTSAIILPSCEVIGANSIIASGAVVTKNVPENTIVGGNPAKVIRTLNVQKTPA